MMALYGRDPQGDLGRLEGVDELPAGWAPATQAEFEAAQAVVEQSITDVTERAPLLAAHAEVVAAEARTTGIAAMTTAGLDPGVASAIYDAIKGA